MKRFVLENSLSLFFATIFLASVLGQSFAGQRAYNADQQAHRGDSVSWLNYVLSPDFGGAVMENWQSEFLQLTLFIGATVWLVQKGSAESKPPGEAGTGGQPSHGWVAARQLAPARDVGALPSHLAGAVGEQLAPVQRRAARARRAAGGVGEYVLGADFWERSLQNWQSEFLAVGTMAVFTIYLRQRGSPESKPVGAPNEETGSAG